MAPTSFASSAHTHEIHHRVPQVLLRLRDKADALASPGSDFDASAIEAWLDFEFEALRWGVDPDLSRDELERAVEASTIAIPYEDHRGIHAEDFKRWGKWGGTITYERYGKEWFSLLGQRRHNRISADDLGRAFEALSARAESF